MKISPLGAKMFHVHRQTDCIFKSCYPRDISVGQRLNSSKVTEYRLPQNLVLRQ
jgi:hypothetical protein